MVRAAERNNVMVHSYRAGRCQTNSGECPRLRR